jgi:hypothetical protein
MCSPEELLHVDYDIIALALKQFYHETGKIIPYSFHRRGTLKKNI